MLRSTWLLLVARTLGLWCIPPAIAAAQSIAASEIEIKAAMTYRAAKFIEWPTQAFADAQAPFVLCVMGDAHTLRAFDPIHGRSLGARSVAVRRVTGDANDLRHCHTVFFAREHDKSIGYAIGRLRGLPVFTVGEASDFATRGGMLALITRDQRVRLAFNLPMSKEAGLTVSSQLLKLGTVVGGTGAAP